MVVNVPTPIGTQVLTSTVSIISLLVPLLVLAGAAYALVLLKRLTVATERLAARQRDAD